MATDVMVAREVLHWAKPLRLLQIAIKINRARRMEGRGPISDRECYMLLMELRATGELVTVTDARGRVRYVKKAASFSVLDGCGERFEQSAATR
jgi:hypothetical protein